MRQKGRRVLVTGVGGFIGRHLAEALAAAGAEVVGLAAERILDSPWPVAAADVTDPAALGAVFDAMRPEVVVHLAGLSHVGESMRKPDETMRVNFEGTRNVVEAARGARLVFASSGEVYGDVPEAEQPIAEIRPPAPRSPYARSKVMAEEVALAAGAVVVRSFNAVGPGQSPAFALPSFALQLAEIAAGGREPVLRVGNLAARRDFLHVGDAVDGYLRLLEGGEPGEVYNLASGTAVSMREALDRLMRVSGVAAEVDVEPKRMRPIDIPLLSGDATKLRALGWRPRRGLDAALAELWAAVAPR